jgi:hypothetical protein
VICEFTALPPRIWGRKIFGDMCQLEGPGVADGVILLE